MEAHKYSYEPSFSAPKQQCKHDFLCIMLVHKAGSALSDSCLYLFKSCLVIGQFLVM